MYALKSFNSKVIYIRRHFIFLLEIPAFKLPWTFQNIKKLIRSQTPLLTQNFSSPLVPFSKDEKLIQLKGHGEGGGGEGHQSIRNFAGDNLLPVGESRATEKFLKYFQKSSTQIINTY